MHQDTGRVYSKTWSASKIVRDGGATPLVEPRHDLAHPNLGPGSDNKVLKNSSL